MVPSERFWIISIMSVLVDGNELIQRLGELYSRTRYIYLQILDIRPNNVIENDQATVSSGSSIMVLD